jgi:hypothetical protein
MFDADGSNDGTVTGVYVPNSKGCRCLFSGLFWFFLFESCPDFVDRESSGKFAGVVPLVAVEFDVELNLVPQKILQSGRAIFEDFGVSIAFVFVAAPHGLCYLVDLGSIRIQMKWVGVMNFIDVNSGVVCKAVGIG